MDNFLHFVIANKNKSIFIFLIIISFVAVALKFYLSDNPCGSYDEKIIKISGEEILIEIADQDCKRILGLSGRKNLSDDKGMLFVFEKSGSNPFWMKDMYFPIDILWLDENLRIVGIEKMIFPETFPKVYGKDFSSKYVLELNGGMVDKNDLKVGNFIYVYEK